MAIPIHTTLTCPACGASEDITLGDTSIGPRGRTSDTPVYAFLRNDNWPVTRRDGEDWISCAACGAADITTVNDLGRNRGRKLRAKS